MPCKSLQIKASAKCIHVKSKLSLSLYTSTYIFFGFHTYAAEPSSLFALAFITAIVIILHFTGMSSKHDNCLNNKTNVFGGRGGKRRDCEVCGEVKHERLQTGCDTVSFSSAQIKSPFSRRTPRSTEPGPQKSSSPLNGLFSRASLQKRNERRARWQLIYMCKTAVSVTESCRHAPLWVSVASVSRARRRVLRWCPSALDLWLGSLVCQSTTEDHHHRLRLILTLCANQARHDRPTSSNLSVTEVKC